MSENIYTGPFLSRLENQFLTDRSDVTMTDWVSKHTHFKSRNFSFNGYEFQKDITNDLHPDLVVIKCSQVGLALALDTPVVTTEGWTTMEDIKEGMFVYDERGEPTKVEYVSPIYIHRDCYEVCFSDGSSIIADGSHRWYVESQIPFDKSGFHRGRGRPLASMTRKGVIETSRMAEYVKRPWSHNRNVFSIPNTLPLRGHDEALPIDPYFLGVWLGDGNLHASVITAHEDDAPETIRNLEARGMRCLPSSRTETAIQFRVHAAEGEPSLSSRLKALGLLANRKAIPPIYMRASVEARRELLRGLLDTDGSITKNGKSSFYNTSTILIAQVYDLVHSLGMTTTGRWREMASSVMANGHVIHSRLPLGEIRFTAYAEDDVFALPRKRARLRSSTACRPNESRSRRIVDIRKVPSVPVRCISVDSPSHLFLAGKSMIPTHNTEIQIRKILAFLKRSTSVSALLSLPNEKMFKRVAQTRILPLLETEKIFNMTSDAKSVRSMGVIQIGQSWLYVTGCTEGDATSIPCDALFHDEYDISPPDKMALFQSRLQASSYKITQAFSTPTFDGFGVDRKYAVSDKREYVCRCPACNHVQIPQFNRNFVHIDGLPDHLENLADLTMEQAEGLDLINAYVMCERCTSPLDLNNPDYRWWQAMDPNRSLVRGYRVRPFSTGRLSILYIVSRLMQAKDQDNIRSWYNTVLGEAYQGSDVRLSVEDIEACMGSGTIPSISTDTPVFVGIDVGNVCHIVLGTKRGIFSYNTVPVGELMDHVEMLQRTYNLVGGAIDRFPYMPTAEEVRHRTRGRVMPVEYRGAAPLGWGKDEHDTIVYAQVNRTMAIDAFVKRVRNHDIILEGFKDQKALVIEHYRDMFREELPEKQATWVKQTGKDHFLHASAFYLLSIRLQTALKLLEDVDPRTTISLIGADIKQPDPYMITMRSGKKPYLDGTGLYGRSF